MLEEFRSILEYIYDTQDKAMAEIEDVSSGDSARVPYHIFRLLGEAKILVLEAWQLYLNDLYPELNLDIPNYQEVIKGE